MKRALLFQYLEELNVKNSSTNSYESNNRVLCSSEASSFALDILPL